MEKKRINKLIASICILILTFALGFSAVYAWFVGSSSPSGGFVQLNGDFDLNMQVYRGMDSNRDGILNSGALDDQSLPVYGNDWYNADGVLIPKSARSKITQYLYTPIDRDLGESYDEYIAGTSILLKIVVENKATNLADANISINFANLIKYFYDAKGQTEAQITELLLHNTARIMFKLNNITARIYTNAVSSDPLAPNTQFDTLSKSSVASESSSSVSLIPTINNFNKSSIYLWELSNGEKFVENVKVQSGALLEIDFALSCMQNDEINNGYERYWNDYIVANPTLPQAEIDYIRAMSRREIVFLVSNDNDNLQLSFSINKIYITAVQAQREP